MPNFIFQWSTLTSDDELFFLSLNLSAVSKKSTPGKFSYIWHFQRTGINATKYEKARIHVKSDVFAAVAVVDAKTPFLLYSVHSLTVKWMPKLLCLSLKLLKSLLSIKPPAGNENKIFLEQEIAIIAQRFEENQAVLKSKLTNTTTNKMKRKSKSTAVLFHWFCNTRHFNRWLRS